MSLRPYLLVLGLVALPASSTAQALDSTRAHALVLDMSDDIRAFEQLADIQFIQYGLPTIEAYFGIEIDLPETEDLEPARTRAHLEIVYRERGAEALLEEAARREEEQGRWRWRALALENIARTEGPRAALEAARERGLLDAAFPQLLNGAGLRRLDEVLSWVEDAELSSEARLRLRAQTLEYGSLYEPYRFWQRADSLPEPYRTRVRVQALVSTSSTDTIPIDVLEGELPRMMNVAETLESAEARSAARSVMAACARREIAVCDHIEFPAGTTDIRSNTDVINLTGQRLFEQADNRLEQLRRTEPPLVVARLMAQGLESMGRHCPMASCDLVSTDSLARVWMREILEVEADAIAGRVERTSTWNGTDDVTELQRALGQYLSARDLDATRALIERMSDPDAIGHVLHGMIQAALAVDLVEAVEIYLEHVPDGATTHSLPYSDLIRAGRPDLAERILERAAPLAVITALADWGQRLTRSGRTDEARAVFRRVMSEGSYEYPVGGAQLLASLRHLRMLDEYMDHVRALPTPLERVNGTFPLLLAWVREAQSRRR